MQTNETVTRAELARQVGRNHATLIRWEREGLIPAATRVSYRKALYDPAAARAIRAFAGAAR
jgi:DNA-binding transcriptional MerR regulator